MDVQNTPSKLLKGATGDWEVVIGLEVHAQVTSQAKLFSGASTAFGGDPNSVFDRKNYFYPDLPQGYQISQYKSPVVGEGEVVVDMPDGGSIKVGIERLHLEQDAGKSVHDRHPA